MPIQQRILVTGHRGRVGEAAIRALEEAGATVVGYDLADGQDTSDADSLIKAAAGCQAIVHLAAMDQMPEDSDYGTVVRGTDDATYQANVAGITNVLRAAEENHVERVVFTSSVDVYGLFGGQGTPDYLPIDEAHPLKPQDGYSRSKLEGERLCQELTDRTAISTFCLRPPGVFDEETYAAIRSYREQREANEWDPLWEYGAWIDARDLASAILASLTTTTTGHHVFNVSADDITSARLTSLELVAKLLPHVPVHDPERFKADSFATLLDNSLAKGLLGWTPKHRWHN